MRYKKKKSPWSEKKLYFLSEYNFEIKVVSLFTLAIFLLIEDFEIKYWLHNLITNILIIIRSIFLSLINKVARSLQGLEFSDIVGYGLIIYVLYLIAQRWRNRIIKKYNNVKKCSLCESNLKRVKKQFIHKVISRIFFVKVKHMACVDCKSKLIILKKY